MKPVAGRDSTAQGSKAPTAKGAALVGAQAATYNPTKDNGVRAFKGGDKNGETDKICKNRYQ
jgi:hypothetical protein